VFPAFSLQPSMQEVLSHETKMSKQQLLVLIGTCMFQLALTGILYNTLGVIMTEVRADLQIPVSRVSSFNTLRSLMAAICSPLLAKIFFRYNRKRFLLFMAFEIVAGYFLISVAPTTWVWYLAAVLFCPASVLGILIIPYLLMPWFPDRSGMAIGLAAAFSGVGGVIFNPCAALIISAVGWRNAVLVFCAITLLLAVPSVLLIFRYPEPLSARPKQEQADKKKAKGNIFDVLPRFLLVCVALLAGGICSQFVNYISMYATSVGYSLVIAATLTSAAMVGNIGGKLLFGILHDTIGVWKTMCIMLLCVTASAVGFLFFSETLPILYVSGVLFGFIFALSSIGMSKTCVAAYGQEGSKLFSGYHTGIGTLLSAGSSLAVGVFYNRFQSFAPMFYAAVVGTLISVAAVLALSVMVRKKNAAVQ